MVGDNKIKIFLELAPEFQPQTARAVDDFLHPWLNLTLVLFVDSPDFVYLYPSTEILNARGNFQMLVDIFNIPVLIFRQYIKHHDIKCDTLPRCWWMLDITVLLCFRVHVHGLCY